MASEEFLLPRLRRSPPTRSGLCCGDAKIVVCDPRRLRSSGILDIGCGSGSWIRVLAGLSRGTITAVDNHHSFADGINTRAAREGLGNWVQAIRASTDALPF
jgi:ubiquinone/menaquinone biosynthesis C-methylase UbiE